MTTLEALPHIDMSSLSQSELHALSLCSDPTRRRSTTTAVVVPHLDRTLFNESAGSRRQTYSRLRHQHRRSRLPGLHHPPTNTTHPPSYPENHSILHFLKFFIHNPNPNSDPGPPPPPPKFMILSNPEPEKKRKRGRKPSSKKEVEEVGVVGKNGVVVDLDKLGNSGDELYSGELRKRTVGLRTDEEALGFVRDLEGQWCSRRKRRKYVDAGEFGDVLPVGWKLVLAIRRRNGCVAVYCRRYVSPTGQQFKSCKEVSSYLRSHLSSGETNQQSQRTDGSLSRCVTNSNTSLVLSAAVQEHPHSLQKGDVAKDAVVALSVVPSSSPLDLLGNDISLMEMDNLPEVKVQDLFECYKCNLRFEEKNAYLQHLFSFHQRTTRRYKVGPSVGDGVIIRDGKYECQFCHKVFEERRSYTGHVGVHVRNNARGTVDVSASVAADKNIQTPAHDRLLSRTRKMDALIEITQNSVVETSSAGLATKNRSMPSSIPVNLDGSMSTNIDQVVRSSTDTGLADTNNFTADACIEMGRNQLDKTCKAVDEPKSGESLANKINPTMTSTCASLRPEGDDVKKAESDERMVGHENRQSKGNDDVQPQKMESTCQEIASQNVLASSLVSSAQSLDNGLNHSVGDDMKKDGTDKIAVGNGSSSSKVNYVEPEAMELTFQENAAPNGLTDALVSTVQSLHCDSQQPESDDAKKDWNDNLSVGLGNSFTEVNNNFESETMEFSLQQNSIGLPSYSEPVVQSFHNTSGILSGSSKENAEYSLIGQNLDNETGFEGFRLEEIEHFKYSFDDGHESPSLPAASIGLGNVSRMEEAFEQVGFNSGGIMLNMEEPHQLSTVCVWCRAEFELEAYDSEAHSDSIGFMCPDCKAKISGHLDGGLSMSHGF